MAKVVVVTDSTAYIPKELIADFPIEVAPLQVIWGEESYRDGVDISPVEFYTRLETAKVLPSTSQTPPADFHQIYERLANQGYDILSVHISSRLSGTMDSAVQARNMLPDAHIELVDSRAAGMALGFQALAAARAAHNGASLEECKHIAEKAVGHTGVQFVAKTLEFLHRGGRIGSGAAFIGKLMDIKPILGLRDGKIEALGKARTRNKALETMLDLIVEEIGDRRPVRIASLHANAREQAEALLVMACNRFNSGDVAEAMCSDVSPAIGTHLGPGGLGIAYMAGM